jgi:protein TonB
MALRALLCSKNAETNSAMTAACTHAGIRVEVCSDIFTAIEKGKTQAFSCVIADWADQPEASFLLKRARESESNHGTVVVAVVDHEPTAAEMRDNHLDFLIYRPISGDEAEAVLTKAGQRMPTVNVADAVSETEKSGGESHGAIPDQSHLVLPHHQRDPAADLAEERALRDESENGAGMARDEGELHAEAPRREFGARGVCAAGLVLAAVFFGWRSRDAFQYLVQTPEGGIRVLRESVAALFYMNRSGAVPIISVGSDAQQDAYFSRTPVVPDPHAPMLGIVATESSLPEARFTLSKAFDFPLPMPALRQDPVQVRPERAAIPESMRNSAPMERPLVLTVNPAQMMPVSAPQPAPVIQQFSEPVALSEEAARSRLVHIVNPVYPPEGAAQKLQGAVVLNAVIARDGSVQDLKIVRGYFVLGRAAIAAVKQWKFQPYSLNGHAAATQTTITIDFSHPPG